MESKHKRNYSLGWLIFWIIVCFPVAYYYYFKKQYPDKKILKESPQKYILIGLIVFYIFIMIVSSISEPQTAPEQETQERIEKSEGEIVAEELIKEAEERIEKSESEIAAEELIRQAKEGELSDEFKAFSEACQAGCEVYFPSSAQDMEYTECVIACVLG